MRRVRVGTAPAGAFAALALLGAWIAPSAGAVSARNAFIADEPAATAVPFDLVSQTPTAAPIGVGKDPRSVVVSPDGRFAYVESVEDSTISVIDTATDKVIGKPIPVGQGPLGFAISPDGTRLYYPQIFKFETVGVLDLVNGVPLPDIKTQSNVGGIAVSPDGQVLYVSETPHQLSFYSTATGGRIGEPIQAPAQLDSPAATPDGRELFVSTHAESVVTIDTAAHALVGAPIPVSGTPSGIAISPDGTKAWVEDQFAATVSEIDVAKREAIGKPLTIGGEDSYGFAMAPNGAHLYILDNSGLATVDTAARTVSNLSLAGKRTGIGIVPDQGPKAGLTVTRTGTTVNFDATASSDPDGSVASYRFDYGDGSEANGPSAVASHRYAPGTYVARLTVTDNEGCGAKSVSTGEAVLCNATGGTQIATIVIPGTPTPAPPIAPAKRKHHARLHLGRLDLNPTNGTATLALHLGSAGTLTVSGQIPKRKLKVKRAGKVTLAIVPQGKARRKLAATGHATVRVKLGFRAAGLLPARSVRLIGLIEHVRSAGHG